MSIEQPKYTVQTSFTNWEIRRYETRIVAETNVDGPRDKALNEAFSILAGYIFGGNTPVERIAMTAPVTQSRKSERIAMTAPVLQQKTSFDHDLDWIVQFTMPSNYTIDNLPRPTDSRVRLREVPASTLAVLRFSGFARTRRLEAREKELREALAEEGFSVTGDVVYAFYNPPFTPPPLRHNEVMLPVSLGKPSNSGNSTT